MMPAANILTVKVGTGDQKTDYAGQRRRWKNWGVRHSVDVSAQAIFMDIQFKQNFEDTD